LGQEAKASVKSKQTVLYLKRSAATVSNIVQLLKTLRNDVTAVFVEKIAPTVANDVQDAKQLLNVVAAVLY